MNLNELIDVFNANANPADAIPMEGYMRNKFAFLGIRSVERGQLQKDFISATKKREFSEINNILHALWNQPYREFHYTAAELLRASIKKCDIDYLSDIEYFITTKSWWDSVDGIAPSSLGMYFKMYPQLIEPTVSKWIDSGNIWLQRSAILFQLKYKKSTDFELLKYIINRLKGGNEFFVNKAIGWALREYSKVEPQLVLDFVISSDISGLARKEALKIINKQNI